MAETTTLLSVIDRLKTEGDLDRDSGSNSIKSLKESVSSIVVGIKKEFTREGQLTRNTGANSLKSLKDAIVGNDLAKAEKEKERQSLLQSIAANIGKSNNIAKAGTKNKPKEQKGFLADLAIVFGGFSGILVKFSPIFAKVGGFFSPKGPLFKLFGKGGSLAKFGGSLGRVFRKIAWPITLAFAAFKGILGGIKGWKKGGIMGAIKGFFMGIFDALIGDTLKLAGNLTEMIFSIFGFKKLGKKINGVMSKIVEDIRMVFSRLFDNLAGSVGAIIEGFKGVFSGVFDAVKALFSGDTGAFKEALANIWAAVKKMIVGDGEGGGVFGSLKDNLIFAFKELPGKIATFFTETLFPFLKDTLLPKLIEIAGNMATVLGEVLIDTFFFLKDTLIPKLIEIAGNIATVLYEVFTETVWPYLSTELLPQMLEIAKGLGKLFTETVWPYLKDTLLPKMLEIGSSVGKKIGEVFMELMAKLKDIILNPLKSLKKLGSGIKGLWPFGKKKDDLAPAQTDAKLEELAPDQTDAKLEELRTTDTTGFSEDQQALLGTLREKLAYAKTEEDRLYLAKAFREWKLQEKEMGTEGLFSDEFKKEQARLFSENRNNTGAQLEMGMAEIAKANSQPATVVVSEGSSQQTTTVNNSTTNISGSAHQDETTTLIFSAA